MKSKLKIKRILAFLCAVVLLATTILGNGYLQQAEAATTDVEDGYTQQAEIATEIEPVILEGYKNITIKDFKDGSGNVLASGTLAAGGGYKNYTASGITGFDNVLLSMKLEFAGGRYNTRLDVAGSAAWRGIQIYPNEAGDQLWFIASPSATGIAVQTGPIITTTEAAVDTFIKKEMLFQLAFDFVVADESAGTVNLTLGVYINGNFIKNLTFNGLNPTYMGNYLSMLSSSSTDVPGCDITYDNVIDVIEPFSSESYKNITIKDFKDGSGNVLTPGTLAAGGGYKNYTASGITGFDNVLLSMKLEFAGGRYNTRLDVAGSAAWRGIQIYPNEAGDQLWFIASPSATGIATQTGPIITTTEAAVDTFIKKEMLFQLAFDFVVADESAGTVNLTLGVYINGNFIKNLTFNGLAQTYMGNYLSMLSSASTDVPGCDITYDNVIIPQFPDYEEVTIKDFVDASGNVMEAKAYTRPGTSAVREAFTLANHQSFDGKVLSMNVKFKAGGYQTRLHVAGSNNYNGLWIYPNSDTGSELWIIANTNYTGVSGKQDIVIKAEDIENFTSFVNTEFLFQLVFDFGEVDAATNTADLELGVYINGTLCGSRTFTGCNMTYFGNRLELYREAENSTIIVGSVNEEFPEDLGIQPSGSYEKITFGQFGIIDGKYSHIYQNLAVYGTATGRETLDKTVICGDILYEGSDSSYIIWGGKNSWGWNGIRMFPKSDGTMQVTWYEGSENQTSIATLDSKTAGVAFVGEKYNIMLSSELVDNGGDGNENDIKIGIWFNGVLYNQEYFYVTNMGEYYGNYFGVYCGPGTDTPDSVTLGSVPELLTQPGEDLEKLTFTQYGIDDGVYTEARGALKTKDSVAGTVLCGNITLKITDQNTWAQIVLGGTSKQPWDGIRLMVNETYSDRMIVRWYTESDHVSIVELLESKAGVDFNGEEFNLMMSVELVDNDNGGQSNDIKLGIWINGFLYNNQYFIIENKGDLLGNYFLAYSDETTINAIPELAKLPDKSFDKVTFSDFGYETDIYKAADGAQYKTATNYTTLDKVVFSGDFRLSDSGTYYIMYGGKSAWDSMRLTITSDSSAYFGWYNGNTPQAYTTVQAADVGLTSFTKETFNLKISTELVDNDRDGEVNDIKVGIWFNNIIYPINGNDYSIITDWGDLLGNYFSIYQATEGTNVLTRNVAEYQSNPYYYEDISLYRNTTGYTYPTMEGYVFSGWYADEEYTEWIGKDVTSGPAWAKFVEDDVLIAKPQVMVDSGTGEVTSGKTSLRFATTVDSLNYRKVSFYLQKQDGEEKDAADLSDEDEKMVYERLYYIDPDATGTMSYKPNAFSWQSEYFKTFTLFEIPESDYGVMIKATPFWVTMDGTEVRGKTLETCVNYYEKPGTNLSKAVSIDFLGEDVMPITGYFGPYLVSNESDPLLLPDYNTDMYFKMIADLGVNLMVYSNTDYASHPDYVQKQLELGGKYGIGIYVNDSSIYEMTEDDMLAQIKKYSGYKAFSGMYLVDEPGTDDYEPGAPNGLVSDYSNAASILNKNSILYYANMFPAFTKGDNTYSQYINDFNNGLNPKVMLYDYYPFNTSRRNTDGTYKDLDLYFWNMDAIRDKARDKGKPFWTFVQAGSQWNDASDYFESTTPYYPSEGEFNWNANTALAFGAQGIQYFPLIQPYHFAYAGSSADDKMWDFYRNGLIGAWGNKTQWYDYAQSLNVHIAAIDGVLMNSYSEQIIAIGSAQSDTSGLSDVTTDATYEEFKSITATNGAIIGYFDYCGKTALYVVNYDYASAQNITLEFDNTHSITKIENAETTETSTSSLTLNMEAGEGILLVIE